MTHGTAGARTGRELTSLLADLPHDHASADATAPGKTRRELAAWSVIGTSAAGVTSLAALAAANALSHPAPRRYDRQLAQQVLAHLGLKVASPGGASSRVRLSGHDNPGGYRTGPRCRNHRRPLGCQPARLRPAAVSA